MRTIRQGARLEGLKVFFYSFRLPADGDHELSACGIRERRDEEKCNPTFVACKVATLFRYPSSCCTAGSIIIMQCFPQTSKEKWASFRTVKRFRMVRARVMSTEMGRIECGEGGSISEGPGRHRYAHTAHSCYDGRGGCSRVEDVSFNDRRDIEGALALRYNGLGIASRALLPTLRITEATRPLLRLLPSAFCCMPNTLVGTPGAVDPLSALWRPP